MQNTGFTLADWMEESRIPYHKDARKYIVGQNLSDEDARIIKSILAGGIAYDIGLLEGGSANGFYFGYGDQFFYSMFLFLMGDFRVPCESNWADALWDTLAPEEIMICNRIAEELKVLDDME